MAAELTGIIGGTGLGDALEAKMQQAQRREVDTPFGPPSGSVTLGKVGGRRVAFLNRHGAGHKLAPGEVPYAANIFALKKLGVHTLIATGAVGSLREQIEPGDLVLVDQFIDKTFRRLNTFFGGYGAVHCEMAEPVCSRLREAVAGIAKETNIKTHSKGTYVCMEGPQFSTRAEALMHRAWGADLIGMTAMPEAKLATEAQMCYCLVALVSDYDCWRPHKQKKDKKTLLEEIIGNLQKATDNCLKLIEAVLASGVELVREDCTCRKSLELAVWTEEGEVGQKEKDRLSVLFE